MELTADETSNEVVTVSFEEPIEQESLLVQKAHDLVEACHVLIMGDVPFETAQDVLKILAAL